VPRAKKNVTEVVEATEAAPAASLGEMAAGLGNLSPEDLEAIRGAGPLTGTEMLTSGAPASVEHAPMGEKAPKVTPEEINLGARMVTLEQDMRDLKAAMEKWAQSMNQRFTEQPRHGIQPPAPVHAASADEQAAYFKANFDLSNKGQTPFDGIQAWRDAGSPKS
jgi:hypothetical protein